jgi:predicted PurR-regulated permease PerM
MSAKLANFTLALLAIIGVGFLLVVGQQILMPLVIAIILWYLIISLLNTYQKFLPQNSRFSYYFSLILAIATCFLLIWLLGSFVGDNFTKIQKEAGTYQEKLESKISGVFETLESWGIDLEVSNQNTTNNPGIDENSGALLDFRFEELVADIALELADIPGKMTIIFLYVLFLLIEHQGFDHKLRKMFPNREKYNEIAKTLERINSDSRTYIKIKTLVSLLTGFLTYLVLKILGVDFAEFFGLLTFLLNYIPNIGSLIAVGIVTIFAWIDFETIYPALIILSILFVIQFAIGGIVEPKLMGKSLNLSTVVILFVLTFWGTIWGFVGAIICVPITVIINIILAKFESTRPLAILLSAKGNIN